MAVQEGPTNIRVSWSPPTPLGDTTGYRIYYSGGSSGSEDVSDGSTDKYLLTGLQNRDIYTISIVTLSTTSCPLPPSDAVEVMNIHLGIYNYLCSHVIPINSSSNPGVIVADIKEPPPRLPTA